MESKKESPHQANKLGSTLSEEKKQAYIRYDKQRSEELKKGRPVTIFQLVLLVLLPVIIYFGRPNGAIATTEHYVVLFLVFLFLLNIAILMLRLRLVGYASVYAKTVERDKKLGYMSDSSKKKHSVFNIILIIFMLIGLIVPIATLYF